MKKILLSAMALVVVASTSAQDLNATFEKAISSYSAKDYAAAADCLQTIISEGMDSESAADMVTTAKQYLPQCYYFMGGAGLKSQDYESARANFQRASELAELYDDITTMTKSNQWIGVTYERQGGAAFNAKNYAAALPIFEMGCEADPRNAKMANWLGICYAETGNYDKAMEVFAGVVKVGTANSKYAEEAAEAKNNITLYTMNHLADLQKNKDYNGIISMANNLLAQDASNAVASKALIQAYSDQKNYAKVIELADGVAATQTSAEEKSNVYFMLGAAYNAQEKKAEAIVAFKKVTTGTNVATAKESAAELEKQLAQ
ncbi:MAG: tetratricopeptide repeat protein [Rikenellaceae bacterium]